MNTASSRNASSMAGSDPLATTEVALYLLALAPLLMASDTAIHGSVFSLVTALALLMAGMARLAYPISLSSEARQGVGVISAAFVASVTDLALRALLPRIHRELDSIIPLIALFAYAAWMANARFRRIHTSWVASLWQFAGLTLLPFLFGATRELLAHASLFASAGRNGLPTILEMHGFSAHAVDGLLIASRAPFAWLTLAILLALLRWVRRAQTAQSSGNAA